MPLVAVLVLGAGAGQIGLLAAVQTLPFLNAQMVGFTLAAYGAGLSGLRRLPAPA